MKRTFFLIAGAAIVLAVLAYFRSGSDYALQQTCSVETPIEAALPGVVRNALSNDADLVLSSADAFGTWPSLRESSENVFGEMGPTDACFAERLYVRSARLGNSDALDRLDTLYDCSNPLNYGVARSSGFDRQDLRSGIGQASYSPSFLRCGMSDTSAKCQTPEIDSVAYLTKQAILCDDAWND